MSASPVSSPDTLSADPICWRCKTRPGVVDDGSSHSCVVCAGTMAKSVREMLAKIDEAVREGLPAWPRCMDRVEFVRECVKLQRGAALLSERPTLSQADALIERFRACVLKQEQALLNDRVTPEKYDQRVGDTDRAEADLRAALLGQKP
jgi:hypothetical protein